jgi:hypothetical protein
VAQVVKDLSSKHETLSSNPNTEKKSKYDQNMHVEKSHHEIHCSIQYALTKNHFKIIICFRLHSTLGSRLFYI